jgi:hypothetical protein
MTASHSLSFGLSKSLLLFGRFSTKRPEGGTRLSQSRLGVPDRLQILQHTQRDAASAHELASMGSLVFDCERQDPGLDPRDVQLPSPGGVGLDQVERTLGLVGLARFAGLVQPIRRD